MLTSIDAEQLTATVLAEAHLRKPRTPERCAACHLWASLITSPTLDAARRAAATFGETATQQDAAELLGRLTAMTRTEEPA